MSTTSIRFVAWLEQQLRARGWSQIDLAKRAELSAAGVSKLMSGDRKPGVDAVVGIARAFNMPTDDVLREAGILPPKNTPLSATDQRDLTETMDKIAALSPESQRLVFGLVDKVWRSEQR